MKPNPETRRITRGLATPQRAFTLLELLIGLLLAALIVTLALPSHRELMRRAHRAQARSSLMHAAHALERRATATGAYPSGDLPAALARLAQPHYLLQRLPPTQDANADEGLAFVLVAVPQGDQAHDRCGSFTLASDGELGLRDAQASVAECWSR